MADLTVTVEEVKGATLVVLAGPIDGKTIGAFQTQMNSVRDRGAT